MMLSALLTSVLVLGPAPAAHSAGDLVAIRVGKAETASGDAIEHAVVLVEDGKIVAIGEDLPLMRGVPVIDRPGWVATPGFVNCGSRVGLDGRGGRSFSPQLKTSDELYARQDVWAEVLEAGVTTLGLQPPGSGIPGQSVAVRPRGATAAEMIVTDPAYLEIHLQSNAASKKMLRDAFEELEKYDEKVAKAREKWEKAKEKYEKEKKKKKKDDEEEKDDKKLEDPGPFVAPEPDEKVAPILALRAGELRALVVIGRASDYLHLLDVIEGHEFEWSLTCVLRNDIDLYEVAERVGEAGKRIALTSRITLMPATRRERNLPAEFHRAGASVALLPTGDSPAGFEAWRHEVGLLVKSGLDRDAALRAMTIEPAHVLGVAERLGSLEVGKDANIVLWDGDPFEPQTRIQAVLLEGEVVHGEVWNQ